MLDNSITWCIIGEVRDNYSLKELKMAKQVVNEVRNGDSVKITYHYNFDSDLIGKKEFEEVVVGNTTKYWIRVPDEVVGVTQSWKQKQEIIANRAKIKAEKKREAWNQLQAEKRERIARYAEMAKRGELFTGELKPTAEDRISAAKLQKASLRAQNKKLCKIV